MAKVAIKNGAILHLSTPITKITTENETVKEIVLENGKKITYDEVIINADFGTAMTRLFEEKDVEKYKKSQLDKKGFSCSTFMVYIALDTLYDLPFHSIYFAKNYRDQLDKIH